MADSKVCMSCLGTENVFNIFDTHECEGNEEIYSEMLKFCFDISILKNSTAQYLCENCILKLREAYFFKQDVIRNIKVFEVTDSDIELIDDTASSQPNEREIYIVEVGSTSNIDPLDDMKTDDAATDLISKNNKTLVRHNVNNCQNVVVFEVPLVKVEKSEFDDPISEEEVFKCEHCPKKFGSKVAIARHSKTHLEGPFACSECDQVFAKLNSRNAHIWRVHKTTEPYVCSECSERFTTFHKRLVHLQEAHNIKPQYRCSQCDKIFTDTSSRWQHIRNLHMRVRNHKCTECKMAFFKRRELLSHMSNVHGIGEKQYSCDMCNKSFFLLRGLTQHLKRHEARLKKLYTCFLCQTNFNCKEDVIEHLKTHEKNEHLKTHEKNEIANMEIQSEISNVETIIVEDEILEGSNDTIYYLH